MSVYQQGNIKLQDALSIDIEQNRRIWFVLGLQITFEGIPQDATGIRTLVVKTSNDTIAVTVEWFAKKKLDVGSVDKFFLPYDEGLKHYMRLVANVSKIEELQNTFPHLFELEGFLYAL